MTHGFTFYFTLTFWILDGKEEPISDLLPAKLDHHSALQHEQNGKGEI